MVIPHKPFLCFVATELLFSLSFLKENLRCFAEFAGKSATSDVTLCRCDAMNCSTSFFEPFLPVSLHLEKLKTVSSL